MKDKRSSCAERRRQIHIPICSKFRKSWQEKVQESGHPTYFGKISMREKKNRSDLSRNGTHQILKQDMILGVYKHKKCFSKKARFPSHSSTFDVVRRTNTTLDVLQECQIDMIGMLTVTRYSHDDGSFSPSSLY